MSVSIINQARFSNWQNKQCAHCQLCDSDKDTMQCEIFYQPYYVWGEYKLNSKRSGWIKIKKAKQSPKTCWGFRSKGGAI